MGLGFFEKKCRKSSSISDQCRFRTCIKNDFLLQLLFSVFGLGSRHYEDFAVFGEFVDSRCAQVGGRRVSPFLRGDSSKDINRDFEKWCSELCKNLARAFPALSHPNPAKPTKKKKLSTSADLFKSTRRFPARESFVVTLIGRDLAMPTPQSSSLVDIDATCTNVDKKTTLHLTFRSETELPSWLQAGDHVGFYPQNGPAQVERACRILGGVDPERREKILLPAKPLGGPAVETEIRLGDILRDEVDLTGHCASPETLRNLVAWITSLELRALARELTHVDSAGPVEEDDVDMIGAAGVSIPRLSKYERWVRNRHLTVLDLMEIFDCQPTVAAFLRVCPRMEPRLYSIATCEQGGVGQVFSLCVALVKYREAVSWRKHFGLASGMLCMGCTSSLGKPGATSAAVTVRMFSRNSGFHLLQNPAIPMIMFAVGSGVGPYVGFLQGRMRSSAMEMNRVVVQQSSAAGADGGQQQALMGHPLKLRRINRVDEDTTMSGALSNEQGGGCDDCSCGQGGGCGTSYGKASLPASQDHVGHSFSHHRLYFGVQDRDSFLYRDFLETISDKTGPHKLNLSMAFSREDPTKKHYVQDACLFGWSWADADH